MSRLRSWLVVAAVSVSCAAGAAGDKTMDALRADYRRPDAIPFPDDDPFNQAKADLGDVMFHDKNFSGARSISCAGCHQPALGWSDGLPHARGEGDRPMALRTPTLLNVAWIDTMGWDGKFPSLESVSFTPITGTLNMNMPEPGLIDRIREDAHYAPMFKAAFGDMTVTRTRIEQALATYERTIVSGEGPFDRWVGGDETAISEQAKKGFLLFNGKAGCAGCHSGWAFTDGSFHDIGTATDDDIGRGRFFPTSIKLRYAFKTPSLRDVGMRAPYMHTGAVATLADVIDLYDRGGIQRPSRSELIKPLGLTPAEKSELLAFLATLTSDTAPASAIR